ncbi:MAG: TRAP transporter large permease [Flavobacteriaceae bacterium]
MFQYAATYAEASLSAGVIFALLALLVLFFIGVPIWLSLGIGATLLIYNTNAIPLDLLGESLFAGLDAFPLIAVPLFVLTGDALVRTGLSNKLLDVAEAMLGSIRSGFGTSTVLGCGFFSCISGSDAAGAAAVGRIATHRLVEKGYPPAYAAALVAAGSCTGILIPPSIGYIIIGLVLGISVSTLFIAALIPGLLVLIAIMLTNVILNYRYRYEESKEKFSMSHLISTLWEAKFALFVPVFILGGIYSGIFTPTEAAGAAVVFILSIGFFQKPIGLRALTEMLLSSVKVNGVIVPIIAISLPLAQALSLLQIPQTLVGQLTSISSDPAFIIAVMLLVFVVAGCFMEATPNIVILGPLMLPLATTIGMDPIHFSIFMLTALGLGFITPPLGLNLFVLSAITGTPTTKIARFAVSFVLSMLLVAVILAMFPILSLALIK